MDLSAWFLSTSATLLIALLIENVFGYPDGIFRRIGHPVTWIGALISRLDQAMNQESDAFRLRRGKGILALLVIASLPALLALGLSILLIQLLPAELSLFLNGLLAASLVAQKSLRDHVRAVPEGLEQSLDQGRKAVSLIVGRDTRTLDEAGVARAAVESLAENSSDGVVAPAFWCLLFGLPGLVFYKAVNTADSMIGHKSDRHLAFGWAAARLDDLINLPWSRLCALLFAAAAVITPGTSARQALQAAWRDAGKHQSPNAGWPEAAMAGALDFALGGPRSYEGETIDLPTMGSGRSDLDRHDIHRALRLQNRAMAVMIAGVTAIFAACMAV